VTVLPNQSTAFACKTRLKPLTTTRNVRLVVERWYVGCGAFTQISENFDGGNETLSYDQYRFIAKFQMALLYTCMFGHAEKHCASATIGRSGRHGAGVAILAYGHGEQKLLLCGAQAI
jgi:hypothetical protein